MIMDLNIAHVGVFTAKWWLFYVLFTNENKYLLKSKEKKLYKIRT